jgi:hypothetical protein
LLALLIIANLPGLPPLYLTLFIKIQQLNLSG